MEVYVSVNEKNDAGVHTQGSAVRLYTTGIKPLRGIMFMIMSVSSDMVRNFLRRLVVRKLIAIDEYALFSFFYSTISIMSFNNPHSVLITSMNQSNLMTLNIQ